MIEIICNGEESKGQNGTSSKSATIRVPKNIKQIGDVSSDKKIYIEDYAFTYINSIAYGTPQDEQAGVLLGECQKSDDEKCLFIKGVIKARGTEENGKQGIYFDERIWNGIYSDIEKYFPNLQVVGWFVAMPNVNTERMKYLKRVHINNFAGNMKTMYLINTMEKEENFYLYENGDLKRQKGYVCFYERNYEMQEYMLEKRGTKSIENENPEKDTVMKSIRNVIHEKEEFRVHKRNTTFMYGISSFMVVVVLVIGINLMNSYEKMKSFDQSLSNIISQISNLNESDGQASDSEAVDSDDVVPVNKINGNVYPTEEETTQAATSGETASTTASTEGQTSQEVAASAATTATQAATYQSYIVQKGDTIMSICKAYYGSASRYSEVIALNNLEDANKLYVGQEIKLP